MIKQVSKLLTNIASIGSSVQYVYCSSLLIVVISCCEKTLSVMRASHDAILTIVQVLLYDPLYVWTISLVRGLSLIHI